MNELIKASPEERTEPTEEELKAYEEVNERVAKAKVPQETIEGIEKEFDAAFVRYGNYFASREDSDLFAMLPLSNKQRAEVLNRAYELEHPAL